MLFSCLPSCKKEEPVAAPPRLKSIVGVSNLELSKSNDFGGVLSQSFVSLRSDRITALRFLIEGRENPRDLLVLLRHADENGYPIGEVLASGLGTVIPGEKGEATWHEIALATAFEAKQGVRYSLELMPSKPHHGYGYSEYAYSLKDAYPGGRLHTRGFSRKVPEDRGEDLCFAVIYEVPETDAGDEAWAFTEAAPALVKPPAPPATEPDAAIKAINEKSKAEPELTRLLNFLRMHHLNFDDMEGVRVQMWARRGKGESDLIVDKVLESPKFDIYYGHSDENHPMFHMIDAGGGGGTLYLPDLDRTHYYPSISLDEAFEKSVLIGKEYSSQAKIWLKLSRP
ncbi:MAG: hypothetical protein AAGB14_14960, partial [Verrucomicrobiota bacterium]